VEEAAPLVHTSYGRVRGVLESGIARFLGVPYAAPPFGPLRFELPVPPAAWSGVRDATAFGPTPPQTPYTGAVARLLPSVRVPGDDILNLNIWTPEAALRGGDHLPVMVWIYGGALTRGCNALPLYDGTPFARAGVVLVVINYRVGVEGFALLEGAPPNRGLADAVAALRWVREEISNFGGDPDDVTVFGQSAGGGLVSMLLASPKAEGLFRKAAIMSAAIGPSPDPPARTIADHLAEQLGIAPTKEAFAAVAPDELAAAQTRLLSGASIGSGGLHYYPVAGDDLLPVGVWPALREGRGADVPVLIGTTAEEHRLWYAPGVTGLTLRDEQARAALTRLGVDDATFDLYAGNRPGETPGEVLGSILLDRICRVGLNLLADRRAELGGRTWVYEFAWRSPVLDLRAGHCVDLPFLFDNLDDPASQALVGRSAPRELARLVHGAFVRFARCGDPDWEMWNPSRPVMTFDSPRSAVVLAPREDERLALTR
jgi:para-nitrobenzyl esterase